MEKPNFEDVISKLETYSHSLKSNNQLGNSILILAYIEIVKVMAWSSSQQDTTNIQTANLIGEVQKLKQITDENAAASSQNASSANWLSRLALLIAIAALLAQVYFSYQTNKSEKIWQDQELRVLDQIDKNLKPALIYQKGSEKNVL